MQSLRNAGNSVVQRAMKYRHFYRVVRRDIRIASGIAMALIGLLTMIEKHWPDALGRAGDIALDFFKWLASLTAIFGF